MTVYIAGKVVPVPNVSPITPSQRLPLIHRALQEAEVMYVELRYEGRGKTGGYIIEYHDRHKDNTRWSFVAEETQRQLFGFLWALVLRRQPCWDQGPGSFGVIHWDVRADWIQHFHHQRLMEIKTSLTEGL